MQNPLLHVPEQHWLAPAQGSPVPRQLLTVQTPFEHRSNPQQSLVAVQLCVATWQPIAPQAPFTHVIAQH